VTDSLLLEIGDFDLLIARLDSPGEFWAKFQD
jgi:hypothetical protein